MNTICVFIIQHRAKYITELEILSQHHKHDTLHAGRQDIIFHIAEYYHKTTEIPS